MITKSNLLLELDSDLQQLSLIKFHENHKFNYILVESPQVRQFMIRGVSKNKYSIKEITIDRRSGETSGLDVHELLLEIQRLLSNN